MIHEKSRIPDGPAARRSTATDVEPIKFSQLIATTTQSVKASVTHHISADLIKPQPVVQEGTPRRGEIPESRILPPPPASHVPPQYVANAQSAFPFIIQSLGTAKDVRTAPEIVQNLETDVEPEIRSFDTQQIRLTANTAIQQSQALPRHVAVQIANAASGALERPVELALNPPELGNVRLRMTSHDQSIVVHVLAERPETLDLLRRHIDQLGAEFSALGYSDIGFAFSHGEMNHEGQGTGADPNADTLAHRAPTSSENPTALGIQLSADGLDIRL